MLTHPLLSGIHVTLEPLTAAHRDALRSALDCDPENWALQLRSAMGAHFSGWWDSLTSDPTRLVYVVFDVATGAVAGTSSYLTIDPVHRTLEVGGTWFRPEFRGTRVNPETKLLMLDHAFDAGVERVQFTVDARNARSRAAMRKLGAVEEGVIRRHKITWTGHKRNSALFSIIAEEWHAIGLRLMERLGS